MDPRVPVDQVRGQPGHALDVEVVGRLVEDEHLVVPDEQRGQRDPAALAAGQGGDVGVERDVGRAGPRAPTRMRESVAHSCSSAEPCTTSRTVLPASRSSRWSSIADPHAAGAGDAAVVGLLEAGQDAQQGGLAGAVGADDADPVAVVEPEGDVVEKGARAERERDAVRAEKVSHFL